MRVFYIVVLLSLPIVSVGQDTIRFSGVVVDAQLYHPVEGTVVLNNSIGERTLTDSVGFFSIEARRGDTLMFYHISYLSSLFIIPEVLDQSDYGVIQLLTENSRVPGEVKVYSFPTEEEFKEAFVDPNPKPNLRKSAVEMRKDLMQAIKETYDDEKYYYEMWTNRRLYELTGEIPPNNFLNPLRWTEFINKHFSEE